MVIGEEYLILFAKIHNNLLVPLRLDNIYLELVSSLGTKCTIKTVEEAFIDISAQSSADFIFKFISNIEGRFKAQSLIALANNSAFLKISIDSKNQRINRKRLEKQLHKQDDDLYFCIRKFSQRPRLEISVEGLSDEMYENQTISATIIVSNTGNVDANDVLLFVSGIKCFQNNEVILGDISFGKSIRKSALFKNQAQILEILLFAVERKNPEEGIVWRKKVCFLPLLRIIPRIINSKNSPEILLVAFINISDQLICGLQPKITLEATEIHAIPDLVDVPQQTTVIFAFKSNERALVHKKSASISVKCNRRGTFLDLAWNFEELYYSLIYSKELYQKITVKNQNCQKTLCDVVTVDKDLSGLEEGSDPWRPRRLCHLFGDKFEMAVLPKSLLSSPYLTFYYDKSV